ncbi:MAG: ImmA/IrrE family metallo-endopeptidase, partial [Deltaproteobacteria bacterium]|nr:ImmA/IrrE family metallo-endopeptidase [Deltaproteobacteria bacterium]
MSAETSAVDAFSFWHGARPCIFLNPSKRSASRSRFDIAHELGHLVLHADAAPGSPIHEKEANAFASAFLLPRETFGSECPTQLSWSDFWKLKE